MYRTIISFLAVGALFAVGCGETSTTAEGGAIADALEQENGGLTMEDEAPAFGEPESFEEVADYEGVTGPITYRGRGDPPRRLIIARVRHGGTEKYQEVMP